MIACNYPLVLEIAKRVACAFLLLAAAAVTLRAQSIELPVLSPQQVSDLHGTVLGVEYEVRGDPAPARLLARMYAAGKGTPGDDVAACALALTAQGASRMRRMAAGEELATYERLLSDAEAFTSTMCGALSSEQQIVASNSVGCLAVGMPEDVVQLGTVSVRIGRAGIGVLDAPAERVFGLPNCPQVVSRARPVTLLPTPMAGTSRAARQFVEVLYWIRGGKDGGAFGLYLLLLELRHDRFEAAAMELLKDATSWPDTPVDIRTWYEMRTGGRIRFEVDGEVRRRGWIE